MRVKRIFEFTMAQAMVGASRYAAWGYVLDKYMRPIFTQLGGAMLHAQREHVYSDNYFSRLTTIKSTG